MIKFIDLSDKLMEDKRAFAFYNTETHHFLSFYNREIWYSYADFQDCLENEKDKDSVLQIDEYKKIIPSSYL
ncbi:MAG: hypothetical protein IPI31_02355 [Bacteroidetes bacterium]|jgi:hypothetical protein|nr:hypothetical protein [Bacteroidota bacterium]MBK7566644.1 hypothetical protein [Bacteroidota bacterium]MBP8917403.1 hypothetical protein [Chitinophagales bacterium]MBP9795366.1 hypothetical protein [Chitinophagales bacterium]